MAEGPLVPDFRTEAGLIEFVHVMWPGFSITTENLRRPTEEFVLDFCVKWLSLFKTPTQNLYKLSPEQRALTDNPEVFSFTIHIINIYKITMTYLTTLKCATIRGILDFVSPTPKSVRVLGNYTANFSAFNAMFYNEYKKRMEAVREKATKNQKLRDEIARLETALHNKRKAKLEKAHSLKQMEEENVQVEENIEILSVVKSQLSQKISALRVGNNSAKMKYEETLLQCQKLEAHNAELRKQMIDYSQNQQKLKCDKEKFKELTLKIEEIEKINKIRENNKKTISSLNFMYEKCLENFNKVNVVNEELSMLENKIKSHGEVVEKLTQDLETIEKKKNVCKNIIVKLESDLADNKNHVIIQEKLKEQDSLLKQLKHIQLQQETSKSQYDALKLKKLEAEKEVEKLQSEFDAKKNFYTDYYNRILCHAKNTFEEQKANIQKVLDLAKERLEKTD